MTTDPAGLPGALFLPDGPPAGAVLVLGGSEGGHHPDDARALADHGWAAFSLAYFGAPGTPHDLVEVPLEHLVRGVDALVGATGGAPVGVLGGSRGGEAALLLASLDPRVRAVVSVVGSGLVTPGIDRSLGGLPEVLAAGTTAWTWRGEPVPTALGHVPAERVAALVAAPPVRLRDTYLPVDPDVRADLAIPVERGRAAVLAVSAGEDAMWDSPALSAATFERLARHGHPRPREHVVLPCGHPVAGVPREQTGTRAPGPGTVFDMGGTPESNTAGQRAAWSAALDWFRLHLAV